MKNLKSVLTRAIIILITLSFNMPQALFSQEKEKDKDKSESKAIKVKIAKKDGDVIIDTVYTIYIDDLDGLNMKEELDKIIDLKIDALDDKDLLQDIYISVDTDDDIDKDSDSEKNIMIWTTVDDDGTSKVMEIKCEDGDSKTIVISGAEARIEADKGYVYVVKSDDDSCKTFTIKSIYNDDEDGEHMLIYTTDDEDEGKFKMITKEGGAEKTTVLAYKIDSDGATKTIIIKTLEYKELEKDDKEVLEKAGIEIPKKQLDLDNLMFFPNPSDGKFTLSFDTESKGDLDIKVIDINGKVVFQESFNNFTGKYNKEIDITANSKGTYFLIIQHGKDMAAHKILYK